MKELSAEYTELQDKVISITELYIYHLIVNHERSYDLKDKDVYKLIQKVNEQYTYGGSLEEIVDRLLDGDEYDGDEEEWY